MFTLNSPTGSKEENQSIYKQLQALLTGESDWLANLANTASLLYLSLEQTNWCGFYMLKGNELVLGPFMGKPACVRIPVGKGVCGTAVSKKQTIRVEDVEQFPGHIACDAASRSEIVIPLFHNEQLIGVLDIDSPISQRFDATDQAKLEKIVSFVSKQSDWSKVTSFA